MLFALIIGCEVAFWVFVLAGLLCRYLLRRKKSGMVLLACTPAVDLVLLAATVIDLHRGGEAGFVHGLSAIYVGVSIAFGSRMIRWADIRFAHRFAGSPPPAKKIKVGTEHARNEREAWLLHLLAWFIGCSLLYGIILWIGDGTRTASLSQVIRIWSLVLVIDFIISFSYTFWPRRPKT
ncbi:hypothetical protein [Paenibacillus sacheonensis]|uniref:YmcC n=1 Tax=Paenibacillus sacheonensis TaxID=742054 RepID=A0A7X4YTV0_9BACL|nr:hypothetical protein [Paenibacillus sacheonensis]MBM7567496.1 hypothetical protein [Paenibacillus sacheonensis]NBC71399.1 hypothetical protein [Paenibacillus sacheonensis]